MSVSMKRNKMPCYFLLISFLLGLQACASGLKVPLMEADREMVYQAPVINVVHHINRINMTTPSDAVDNSTNIMLYTYYHRNVGGDLASVLSEGQNWPEISVLIEQHMLAGLRQKANLTNLKPVPRPDDTWMASYYHGPGDTLESYRKAFGSSLVLDIRSIVASHFTTLNWRNHSFGITAKAVLVRPSDGKIFWRGFCVEDEENGKKFIYRPYDTGQESTRRIQSFLNNAAQQCADDMVKQFVDSN